MSDDFEYEKTKPTDGKQDGTLVRKGKLVFGEKSIDGVAIIHAEVCRSAETLRFSWTFHPWRYGSWEPVDLSKPLGLKTNAYPQQNYSSRPLVRFGDFDTFADADADVKSALTPY